MFKVGDLVRCVTSHISTRHNLPKGSVHRVEAVDSKSVFIRNTLVDEPEILLGWMASRFVLAERSIPEMILSGDFDV